MGGLWNEVAWRRKPDIRRMNLCIAEKGEKLWLYRVEDEVLMVEVKPEAESSVDAASAIGQVVLKRLISADQAIDLLCAAEAFYEPALVDENFRLDN
jgi:hypothetical protein